MTERLMDDLRRLAKMYKDELRECRAELIRAKAQLEEVKANNLVLKEKLAAILDALYRHERDQEEK